jgi:hypothetical protein
MENIEEKYKILNKDDYVINDELINDFALSDVSISVFNGNYWIVFPLIYLYYYPIIYFDHYEKTADDKLKTISTSLIFCLVTSRCVLVDGIYNFTKYIDNRLILKNNNNQLLPIDLGILIDTKDNVVVKKRYQIRINTLRNALIEFQDIKYLHIKNKIKNNYDKFNYYSNRYDFNHSLLDKKKIHPKTLVYIINYLANNNKYKNTIIIGSDPNSTITGYDSRKSGFDDYVSQIHNDLVEHDAFIMPMLYYMAILIYPDAKIIKL